MYRINNVSIFGYASISEEDPLFDEVYETCEILAKFGYTIVNGGGPGVMKAASLGAKAGGGKTIGVTLYPDANNQLDPATFEGRDETNPLDREIVTKSYVERTLTLMDVGEIYVVFNGGTGTISEFGMAWGLAKLHFGRHKPLILYGEWWHDIMEAFAQNMYVRDAALKVYEIVDAPSEVLDAVKDFEKTHEQRVQGSIKFHRD